MAPLSALQRLVGLGCATSAATATRPATTRRGGVEELLNEPGDDAPWTLEGFLKDRGGNAYLERARSAGGNVALRLKELGQIVGHFRGVGYVKSRWLLCEFVAVLVASGVSIQQLALPNINSLSPTMRGVLVLHYAPLLAAAAGPLLPEGHPCIQFFVTDVFKNAGLKPALFRQFLLVIDLLYIACPTTGGDGAQLSARNVQAYSDKVHVAAGLDPIERGAVFLLIWRMLMKEGSYRGPLLAAGGAAFDFVAAHLPDFQLLERCAHSQAMRRLGNLRRHLDDQSTKGKKRSLGVPGPALIASSTRAWTTLLTNVADGALDVTPSDRTSRSRAPEPLSHRPPLPSSTTSLTGTPRRSRSCAGASRSGTPRCRRSGSSCSKCGWGTPRSWARSTRGSRSARPRTRPRAPPRAPSTRSCGASCTPRPARYL